MRRETGKMISEPMKNKYTDRNGKAAKPAFAAALAAVLALAGMPACSMYAEDFAGEIIPIEEDPSWQEQADIVLPQDEAAAPEEDNTYEEPGEFVIEDDAGWDGGYDDFDPGIQVREAEQQEALAQMASLFESEDFFLESASPQQTGEYLRELLSQPSPTGSDGELVIGRYIETTMEELGYTVTEQSFHEGFLNENMVDVPGMNILAERGADAPERTGKILVIATHYDSVTDAESEAPSVNAKSEAPSAASKRPDPLANDKSGAAAALELARICMSQQTETNLCFLFLSGEEDGGYGAQTFVQRLEEFYFTDEVAGVIYIGPAGYEADGETAPYVFSSAGGENRLGDYLFSSASLREAMAPADAELLEEPVTETESEAVTVILTETESEAETESLTEDESEAETETLTEAETEPVVPWTYVPDEKNRTGPFAEAGLQSIYFHQVLPGNADWAVSDRALADFVDILGDTVSVYMWGLQR